MSARFVPAPSTAITAGFQPIPSGGISGFAVTGKIYNTSVVLLGDAVVQWLALWPHRMKVPGSIPRYLGGV